MHDAHEPTAAGLFAAALAPAQQNHDVLAATVQALPYKGITRPFAGAVQAQPVNVLLDTCSLTACERQ